MKIKTKQQAHEYFLEKYGDDYTDRGKLMSFGYSTLPRIVRYSPDLSSDAKICYETLTDMVLNTNETIPWLYYPSQKRIGWLSGLRRQLVNKAMKELEQAGLIGSKRQGQGKQNIYCLLAPPEHFIDSAIICRAVLNLIKRGEVSWDDVSDNLEIKKEAVLRKIDAEKSVVVLEVRNNGQQEVTNNGQQEVNSENAPEAIPQQDLSAISEKQELTSVDVTSDDIKIPSCDFSKESDSETPVTGNDTKKQQPLPSNKSRPREKMKCTSYLSKLDNNKLLVFKKALQHLKTQTIVCTTLYELVDQDPVIAKETLEYMKEKEVNHFNYFTRTFLSKLKETPSRSSSLPDFDEHSKTLKEKYNRE